MKNLKTRLAQANGMNSRLCFAAKDEINRLEKLLDEAQMYVSIDYDAFFKATGRHPEQDDLDRVNCSKKGAGHMMCGWCIKCNAPYFECGGMHE